MLFLLFILVLLSTIYYLLSTIYYLPFKIQGYTRCLRQVWFA